MADTPQRVVAITGAANFLGVGVMRRLAQDPRYTKIIAVDVVRPAFEHPRLTYYKVDLTLPNAGKLLAKTLAREQVDTFVHLVFLYGVYRSSTFAHELEAIGTMHILDACADAGVRKIVLRSTTFVYGALPENPALLTEEHPLASGVHDSFVSDKVEAERQIAQFAKQHPDTIVTVLRDAPTVGPTATNFLLTMLRAPAAPVMFGYDPLFQFLHETDAYAAYKAAVDIDAPGPYNIVPAGQLRYSRVREIAGVPAVPMTAGLLRAGLNLTWSAGLYPVPPSYTPFLKYSCLADGDKARRVLGFKPAFDSTAALTQAVAAGRS